MVLAFEGMYVRTYLSITHVGGEAVVCKYVSKTE